MTTATTSPRIFSRKTYIRRHKAAIARLLDLMYADINGIEQNGIWEQYNSYCDGLNFLESATDEEYAAKIAEMYPQPKLQATTVARQALTIASIFGGIIKITL